LRQVNRHKLTNLTQEKFEEILGKEQVKLGFVRLMKLLVEQ